VDLAATARHVLVLAGDRAQKRGVALTGSIPDGLVAQAAQQEVGQVLLNLVLNALDAAGDAGKVDLRGEVSDENVVFQVSDSGPGIPPEVRAKLFTPFFTTKVDGVGLGLSISQKIAREHGGSLTFTTAPGEGTVFTLRLPRTASAARVAEAPPAPAAAARGAVPPAATF
jgi:two-component system sensor histidine kinase HydH